MRAPAGVTIGGDPQDRINLMSKQPRNGDGNRTEQLRLAIKYLLERQELTRGDQSRLAEEFDVSRQWVHQLVHGKVQRTGRQKKRAGPHVLNAIEMARQQV